MRINNIFRSLQGEGCWTGIPALFIRTQGCSIVPKCAFCDTKETWNPEDGFEMSIEDIVYRCRRNRHIVLTGGEPTDQEDYIQLIDALVANYHAVHVETNGLNYDKLYQTHVWITISPKFQNLPDIKTLALADEIKWIIDTPEDVVEVSRILNLMVESSHYVPTFLLQPMSMDPDATELCVQEVLNFPKYYRLSVQLHKYLNIE